MKAFQQLQYRFAAHLRDPRLPPPRGIDPRRMRVYAELFYNNVEACLAAAFPVLRKVTPDAAWHARVRDFYARHVSREPLFQHLPREFAGYLERRRGRGDPPYVRELAHYEWAELALAASTVEITPALADPRGDLLDGVPVLSPLAWPLRYRYAVHRIAPGRVPKVPEPEPVHLVVWRNRRDEVRFMESNAVTARLLELMGQRPGRGRALLTRIARELKHPRPALVIEQGAAILKELAARDIVLGAKRKRR
jgi:hypothetical protein